MAEGSGTTRVTVDALGDASKTPGRATLFRDLHDLMDALYQWALERGDIFWPEPDRQ